MAILNYTTKISPEQTTGEIMQILRKHKCQRIALDYSGDHPSAISFVMPVNSIPVTFTLRVNWIGVQNKLKEQTREKKYHTDEHAQRVAWRILKDRIEAELAYVEAELATMLEVFLPYATNQEGETFIERIGNDSGLKLLTGKQ